MKNCSECGKELPDEVLFCLYCGTNTNISKLIKKERAVFFLTPVFLFLICLGITYDLKSSAPLELGMGLAGLSIFLYFSGAFFFGALKFFFKIWSNARSYFYAAMSALINGITAIFAVFAIEQLYLWVLIDSYGPTLLIRNHFLLLGAIYIPIQFIETLAISAKAKITENSHIDENTTKKLIFSNLYLYLPLFFILITALGFYHTTPQGKTAFYAEAMISLSANEQAKKYLDSGLEKYPRDPKLCYLKSVYLTEIDFTNQEYEEALNLAKIAVEANPYAPIYRYHLSQQLEINGYSQEAIAEASNAANLSPRDAFLWRNLGDLNQKNNDYSNAILAYKKALEIEPNNPSSLNNLSYTLLLSNKDLGIALELAKKSVELMPNSIYNRDTLAWAYYKNRQFNEALESISLLYEEKTEISPEVDFHYAVILEEMNLLKNPIETYDKMIVKPEVASNKNLVLQIIEARQKTEEKRKVKK